MICIKALRNQNRNPAVTGWNVCRMHFARGGGKEGEANPHWKHGGRAREAMALRKMVNDLGREARRVSAGVVGS